LREKQFVRPWKQRASKTGGNESKVRKSGLMRWIDPGKERWI